MSTAEAIHRLRKKLGLRQPEFARLLGVVVTSVSRYENGQEPTTAVLTRLMQLCGNPLSSTFSPEMAALRSLFEAKRRSDIVSTLENLASRGTNRGVPITDLQLLQAGLQLIGVNMKRVAFNPSVTGGLMRLTARGSSDMVGELLDVITPYLSFAPEVSVNNALMGELTEIGVNGVRVGASNEEPEASDYSYLSPLVPGNTVRSGDTYEAIAEVEMILKENLSPEGAAEVDALATEFARLAPSEVKQRHLILDKLRAIRTNVTLGPDRMAEWAAEENSICDSVSGKPLRPEELNSSEMREQVEKQSRARKQRAEDARRQSARPTKKS